MEQATTIGIDLAKRSFQLHGAGPEESVAFRKRLSGAAPQDRYREQHHRGLSHTTALPGPRPNHATGGPLGSHPAGRVPSDDSLDEKPPALTAPTSTQPTSGSELCSGCASLRRERQPSLHLVSLHLVS